MIIQTFKTVGTTLLMKIMMPISAWYRRVSPRMITCREFNNFTFDYTEEKLTEKQVRLFDRHMKVCPMCRNFLKTYVATFKAGKAFFPYDDREVPGTVPADLQAAIIDVSDK